MVRKISTLFLFVAAVSVFSAEFKPVKLNINGKFIKDMHSVGGDLWVATERGLFQTRGKKVQEYLAGQFITSFAVDLKRNSVWVGTPSGLILLNYKTGKTTKYTKSARQLSSDKVNTVLLEGDTIYVGNKLGVDKFSIDRKQWKSYTALEGLAGNDIQDLKFDGAYVWAGGADGISYYDKNEDFWLSYGAQEGLNNPFVTSLSVDTEAVWVGTAGGGVSRFDRASLRFEPLTSDEGLVDDQVQCLVDDGLFLWVGTFDGVSLLTKKTLLFKNFQSSAGLKEPSVFSGLVIGENFYAGTDGAGVYKMFKKIPEVRLLNYEYVEKGRMKVIGRVLTSSGVSKWQLQYKPAESLKNNWFSDGVELESARTGDRLKIAEIDTRKLKNGIYTSLLTVTDSKGNQNQAVGSFIVDNTPPDVKLYFREAPKGEKEVMVTGRYLEENLKSLQVYLDNKKIPPARVDIDRKLKKFRFPYRISSGAKIKVVITDVGLNKKTIEQNYFVDTEPPKLKVNEIDKDKIDGNVVEITGQVEDENIDEVIVNPGTITAELIPVGANRYEFKASARIKKEGKFPFLITAIDKAGRKTTKKITINFVSDTTIVEVDDDKIPEYTLRDSLEFSGAILGPFLKEFYLLVNGDKKIPITINPKTKDFKVKVPLKNGKNRIKMVAIHETGEKAEETFEVEAAKKQVSARLNLKGRAFRERNITLTGTFDKGIRKVFIDNKPAKMDFKTNTYTFQTSLKRGRNALKIKTVDELGRVKKKKEVLYFDTQAPEVFVRTLPQKTGIKNLKFRGRVSDLSPFSIWVYPGADVEYLDPDNGSFEGTVHLKRGVNQIYFTAVDDAGNKTTRSFTVDYDPKYPRLQEAPGAANAEEIRALREEISRLKKLLLTKGKYVPGIIKSNLPKRAGLYYVPLAGKIKSYAVAARLYLGSRDLKELVAMYNAKDPRKVRKVLVPSPAFFALLSSSRNRKLWTGVSQKAAQAYVSKPNKTTVEKRVLAYLLRKGKLKSVKEKKGFVVFELKNGSGFIIGNPGLAHRKKLRKNYSEIIVANVTRKGLLFSRI